MLPIIISRLLLNTFKKKFPLDGPLTIQPLEQPLEP